MLYPDKHLHKYLISTPAHMVGEYSTDDILITHAWPDLMSPSQRSSLMIESPVYRTYFAVVVRIENQDEKDSNKMKVFPNYHPYGDFISVCLSILFGKRFDHHGMMETHGFFCLPANIQQLPIGKPYWGPFNQKPRKDLSIELNLEKVGLISPLFIQKENKEAINIFYTAGLFYLRSLQIFEDQPEIAFVDLVTAGEVLSNFLISSDDAVLDDTIKKLLAEISKYLPDPEKAINIIKSRLFQVSRKYTLTLSNYLNDNFFTETESTNEHCALKKDLIEKRIKASYDLRSRYVHTGLKFGTWMTSLNHIGAEIMIGEPLVEDKEYQKLLMLSPTYLGLERILRYSLLTFLHKNICKIDERLD